MAFYDLSKGERDDVVARIGSELLFDFAHGIPENTSRYFGDQDTYIRKAAYLSVGRIFFANKNLRQIIIRILDTLSSVDDFKVRQTVINAAGEIGKYNFIIVQHFFDKGLFDVHHAPRNAVIGSVKKMGEVNPEQILPWAKNYLHHPDKEIRREICHGIELRGRKFPQDILPFLQQLQHDNAPRVRNTLVHVLGQIAYKKGCLMTVIEHLKKWENKKLVTDALDEIIDVHKRYSKFAAMTEQKAKEFIAASFQ